MRAAASTGSDGERNLAVLPTVALTIGLKLAWDFGRHMASVFQQHLLLNSSVYDNASPGLRLRGLGCVQIERQLRSWLERLGIAHLVSRQARTPMASVFNLA